MRAFLSCISYSSVIFLCVLIQSSAMAETKMFGALQGGLALGNTKIDGDNATTGAGGNFGASVGIQTSDYFRWDLAELNYMSGYQTSRVVGWFDNSLFTLGTGFRFGLFDPKRKIQPYATAGISANRFQVQQYGSMDSEWAFGWNVGGGVEYQLSEKIALGLRYRYRSSVLGLTYCPSAGGSCRQYDSKMNFQTVSLEVVFF